MSTPKKKTLSCVPKLFLSEIFHPKDLINLQHYVKLKQSFLNNNNFTETSLFGHGICGRRGLCCPGQDDWASTS